MHWAPPPPALVAIERATREPATHSYCPDEGLPALRDALKAKLLADNGIAAAEVMVTSGSNQVARRAAPPGRKAPQSAWRARTQTARAHARPCCPTPVRSGRREPLRSGDASVSACACRRVFVRTRACLRVRASVLQRWLMVCLCVFECVCVCVRVRVRVPACVCARARVPACARKRASAMVDDLFVCI